MIILWIILIFPILVSTGQIRRTTISQKFSSDSVHQHPLLHRRMLIEAARDATTYGRSAGTIKETIEAPMISTGVSKVSTAAKTAQANVETLDPSLKSSHLPDRTLFDIQHATKNPVGDVKPVHAGQGSSLDSVKPPDDAAKGGELSMAQQAHGDSPKSNAPFNTAQASQSSRSPPPSTSGQIKEGSTDPCLLRRHRRTLNVPPCVLGVPYPVPGVPYHPPNYLHNGHYAQEPPKVKPTFRSRVSAFARTPPTVSIIKNSKKVGKHSVGLFKSAVGLTAATFYLAAKPFIIGGKWVGKAIGRTAKATIVLTGKGLRLFYKGAKTAGAATATGLAKTSKFGVKAAKAGGKAVKNVGLLTLMGVLGGARLVGKGVIGLVKLLARIGKMTLRGTGHLLAKTGEGIGKAGHKLKNIRRLRMA